MVHLRRAHEARVDPHVLLGIEVEVAERDVHELLHAVRLAGGDHVVVRLVLLEHHPHRLDVILGVAPVALGVHVAERELFREAELDRGRAVRDFAGDELQPPTLRLVVEQDA